MPAPLVCEGPDLDRLLAEVNAQPGAEILYQDRVRRGGMGGFFTREVHRIAYRLPEPGEAAAGPESTGEDLPDRTPEPGAGAAGSLAAELYAGTTVPAPAADPELPALDDLFASVEAAENRAVTGQHRAPEPIGRQAAEQPATGAETAGTPAGLPDFATLLRTLTESDHPVADAIPAVPVAADPVVPDRPVHPVAAFEPAARPSNVTSIGKPDARARLELLMQLRQVGVPVSVNPRSDTHTLYEALESILEDLPAPAVPPRAPGEVLAVVGESGPALQAARTCAAMLRIPAENIGVAGLPAAAGADHPVISGVAEASRLRTELRRADLPSIVVIATDATVAGPDDPWAAEMLAALCPTATWAVVDARWKTEDSRAQLDRLGRVDALVVHSAQLSASPASVWDLDLPLGLLDGRAASTFAWTGLLFGLLRSGARHRATA